MRCQYKSHNFFLILFILIGCVSNSDKQKKSVSVVNDTLSRIVKKDSKVYSIDTTINVGSGFEITYIQDEFSDNSDGSLLTIIHNKKLVYTDKSDFYVLNDSLNPTMIVLDSGIFQIFLEVDNRPSKNYLKMIKIQFDKIIDSQKTPTFSCKPSHLFDDTTLLYADFWDYSEMWTDSNNKNWFTCDPIMYYKLTNKGLVLDSLYTLKKNKEIFGIANIFNEKEFKPISIDRDKMRKKEIERIMNCR